MPAAGPVGSAGGGPEPDDITELIPLVRRVVAARVPDRATVDDLVQETLTRVLAALRDPDPYAADAARSALGLPPTAGASAVPVHRNG